MTVLRSPTKRDTQREKQADIEENIEELSPGVESMQVCRLHPERAQAEQDKQSKY